MMVLVPSAPVSSRFEHMILSASFDDKRQLMNWQVCNTSTRVETKVTHSHYYVNNECPKPRGVPASLFYSGDVQLRLSRRELEEEFRQRTARCLLVRAALQVQWTTYEECSQRSRASTANVASMFICRECSSRAPLVSRLQGAKKGQKFANFKLAPFWVVRACPKLLGTIGIIYRGLNTPV